MNPRTLVALPAEKLECFSCSIPEVDTTSWDELNLAEPNDLLNYDVMIFGPYYRAKSLPNGNRGLEGKHFSPLHEWFESESGRFAFFLYPGDKFKILEPAAEDCEKEASSYGTEEGWALEGETYWDKRMRGLTLMLMRFLLGGANFVKLDIFKSITCVGEERKDILERYFARHTLGESQASRYHVYLEAPYQIPLAVCEHDENCWVALQVVTHKGATGVVLPLQAETITSDDISDMLEIHHKTTIIKIQAFFGTAKYKYDDSCFWIRDSSVKPVQMSCPYGPIIRAYYEASVGSERRHLRHSELRERLMRLDIPREIANRSDEQLTKDVNYINRRFLKGLLPKGMRLIERVPDFKKTFLLSTHVALIPMRSPI
jgi:hypothetical protein